MLSRMSYDNRFFRNAERLTIISACILVTRSLLQQLYNDAQWFSRLFMTGVESTKQVAKGQTAWISPMASSASLDAAGLVALADLSTIQQRTALTGTSWLLDLLVICPGMHLQHKAMDLNRGEYPACGALTSGYVFRVENPATVYFLQTAGRAGHLTTLSITQTDRPRMLSKVLPLDGYSKVATSAYLAAVLWTAIVIMLLGFTNDWWGLVVTGLLIVVRASNALVIRRRSKPGWFGQPEPGVKGDLLVLLSQDRWIRLRGYVDDLKAVTSGQWLRDPTHLESCVTACATVLVYLTVALAKNVQQFGKVLLLAHLLGSASLLAVANTYTSCLRMHGRTIKVDGQPRKFSRRLELARELIEETGRDDWAVRMGIINSRDSKSKVSTEGGVTM